MLALVVASLLLVMLSALVYAAFDFRDTTPFPLDPEMPFFMTTALMMICVGIIVIVARLLGSRVTEPEVVPREFPEELCAVWRRGQVFGMEHLLFSPPPEIRSIRI